MDYSAIEYNQDYGCIPNSRTPECLARIQQMAAPWDAHDRPPVSDWASFEEYLRELPDAKFNWFEKVNADDYFTPSQSYRPNCAGFALSNAATCSVILQRVNRFSEQKIPKFNPMVTWQRSKNWSVSGGQSIAAMAIAGNEYGEYLASDVGDYDPGKVFRSVTKEQEDHAQDYQIGYALYDGDEPWEAALLACQKGFACFGGNSRAVSGSKIDENGVPVAILSGAWSHAWVLCGFQIVNGIRYLLFINSHGPIYESDGRTPRFAVWMPETTVRTFLSSSFNDICVLTYAEAPYDPAVKPTLNPEKEA